MIGGGIESDAHTKEMVIGVLSVQSFDSGVLGGMKVESGGTDSTDNGGRGGHG